MNFSNEDVGGGGSKYLSGEGPFLVECIGLSGEPEASKSGNTQFKLDFVAYDEDNYGRTTRQRFTLSESAKFTVLKVAQVAWGIAKGDGTYDFGPADWSPDLYTANGHDAHMVADALLRRPFFMKMKKNQDYWNISYGPDTLQALSEADILDLVVRVQENGFPDAVADADLGPFWELHMGGQKDQNAASQTGPSDRSNQAAPQTRQQTQTRRPANDLPPPSFGDNDEIPF